MLHLAECSIAKFGEDILNHRRAIRYGCKIFSTSVLTLNYDLDLSKVNIEIQHWC